MREKVLERFPEWRQAIEEDIIECPESCQNGLYECNCECHKQEKDSEE